MKKTRFIALVLAVSLMIMGSGYAYWTDTLVISNDIKTGNFDLDFEKSSHKHNKPGKTPEVIEQDSKYMNADIDIDKNNTKNAIITVTDVYPGGYAKFKVTIKNNGTLPAKYTGADLTCAGGNKALFDSLEAKFSFDNKDIKTFAEEADLASWPGHGNKDMVIDKGASKDFYVLIKMSEDVTELENTGTIMNLKLNWEQTTKIK